MDWLILAVLLVSGAICGAVIRLPFFAVALVAAAFIVMVGSWSQGAGTALLRTVVAMVILQGGYAVGIVLRSLAHSLRRRRVVPGKLPPARAVPLPNEPKRR